jgi:transcriptional regulator with XRE-family HTH domain
MASSDMTHENENEGLLSGLGALRNRLADADPGFRAAARVERDAEALCERIRNDLKSHRVALGVSQKELAKRLELSQPAISKIESGRGDLSIKMVYRVADALGLKSVHAFAPASGAEPESRSPAAQTSMTPEERLLRAIFGETFEEPPAVTEAADMAAAVAKAVQEDLVGRVSDIVHEAFARFAAGQAPQSRTVPATHRASPSARKPARARDRGKETDAAGD